MGTALRQKAADAHRASGPELPQDSRWPAQLSRGENFEVFDGLDEILRHDRFHQVHVESGLDGALSIDTSGMGADGAGRKGLQSALLPALDDTLDELVAAHSRKADVAD